MVGRWSPLAAPARPHVAQTLGQAIGDPARHAPTSSFRGGLPCDYHGRVGTVPFPLTDVVPPALRDYVFDFLWDLDRLHALELQVRTLPVSALAVHLTLPYWRLGDEPFQLTPREVMNDPVRYTEQYQRTWRADLTYPIILCDRAGKPPMILDGVHRLLKAVLLGRTTIGVKVFTLDLVPRIQPSASSGRKPLSSIRA
jgi:hypothetical protein